MQHLSEEDLARLVDEGAGEVEALHLEACEECRAELEEMCAQTRALGRLPELAPSRGAWPALRARLDAEELIRTRIGWWERGGWPLRAAAALALFLAGTATGALALGGGGDAGAPLAAAPASAPAIRPAALEERLRVAEEQYVEALAAYSAATGSARAVDPVNRLAALEGIVLTTRAALEEAPADPVINGYHLSALGQRDAMLRQIDAPEDEEPWF